MDSTMGVSSHSVPPPLRILARRMLVSRGTYPGSALRPLWDHRARLLLGSWMLCGSGPRFLTCKTRNNTEHPSQGQENKRPWETARKAKLSIVRGTARAVFLGFLFGLLKLSCACSVLQGARPAQCGVPLLAMCLPTNHEGGDFLGWGFLWGRQPGAYLLRTGGLCPSSAGLM